MERGDDSIMIHLIIILLVSLGIFFFFGTAVGLLRFPDFYTRTHAAGKGDTLSTVLIILGIILYVLDLNHYSLSSIFVAFKLLLIINFIFIGSPTATHAIMDAGYETGVPHWVNKTKKKSGKTKETK